jgi:hypothetical protein
MWHFLDHHMRTRYSGSHVLQIWDFGVASDTNSHPLPCMVMAVVHNGGAVWDMSWYPDSAWQPPTSSLSTSSSSSSGAGLARLGVLAVSFGDGSLQVLCSICTCPHIIIASIIVQMSTVV